MDIQTAKQIRIADYLHSLGYSPVKQQGINLWYKSPLREETEASFKVNIERNQWYDFALGKGGGTIELASHLYATDHIPYILERIAEQTPHIRPDSFSFGKQSSSEPRFQQLRNVSHNRNSPARRAGRYRWWSCHPPTPWRAAPSGSPSREPVICLPRSS